MIRFITIPAWMHANIVYSLYVTHQHFWGWNTRNVVQHDYLYKNEANKKRFNSATGSPATNLTTHKAPRQLEYIWLSAINSSILNYLPHGNFLLRYASATNQ